MIGSRELKENLSQAIEVALHEDALRSRLDVEVTRLTPTQINVRIKQGNNQMSTHLLVRVSEVM